MITSKPSLRSGFDCIIRPAPSGAGRTTPSQPGHYPLRKYTDKRLAMVTTLLCSHWLQGIHNGPNAPQCIKEITPILISISNTSWTLPQIFQCWYHPVKCDPRPLLLCSSVFDTWLAKVWFNTKNVEMLSTLVGTTMNILMFNEERLE